jgi:hypothetical protein
LLVGAAKFLDSPNQGEFAEFAERTSLISLLIIGVFEAAAIYFPILAAFPA